MTVLLAATPAPPAPPPTVGGEWLGLNPTWTGYDGTEFRLSDPAGGVILTRAGTRGLSMPPFRRFTDQSPAVAGSRNRGRTTDEREIFWPLFVFSHASSAAWVDLERSFWRTMHPDRVGVWSVSLPDGAKRSLTCRFADDGNPAFGLLPVAFGWARYGLTLVAEQPFWQGAPITQQWKSQTPGSFFGAGAPSFTIDSGSTLSNATLDNPGDEESHPIWTITGPCSSVTVGVGGRNVVVPFALATGEVLVIDTRPTEQTAITGGGVERTGELSDGRTPAGVPDFAPVPPGTSVVLSLSMNGTGTVGVSLPVLHHRAW